MGCQAQYDQQWWCRSLVGSVEEQQHKREKRGAGAMCVHRVETGEWTAYETMERHREERGWGDHDAVVSGGQSHPGSSASARARRSEQGNPAKTCRDRLQTL